MRIFVNISREEQKARLQARENPESLKRFYDRWIPLEKTYFAAYGLPDEDCMIINGNAPAQL